MKQTSYWVLGFLLVSLVANAKTESSIIFSCTGKSVKSDFLGEISVDAVGKVFFSVKSLDGIHECQAKLVGINDQTRGVASFIRIEMKRGDCKPIFSTSAQKDILDVLSVRIDTNNVKAPQADFHWLLREQPAPCEIKKISLYELKELAKKRH